MRNRVLCLEPFGGGSHAEFWRSWARHSRHEIIVLYLPAVHWKWRSRHASLTLAIEANRLLEVGHQFDALVCSDMLNLPEWRGFAAQELIGIPTITYFHENQLTYPLAKGQSRDLHFGYSNVLTAIAADQVWFNSAYHRDEFSSAATQWLRHMPDYKHIELLESAMARSKVLPPGIDPPTSMHAMPHSQSSRQRKIPNIGWVARWEHDKSPETFVRAIERLIAQDMDFGLILLGQQFREKPPSLRRLEQIAGGRIRHCGFAPSRSDYWELLSQMDIVVSTAEHEFFGLGIVESIAAGAVPLLPQRLAYPEVLDVRSEPANSAFLYADFEQLVSKLVAYLTEFPSCRELPRPDVDRYLWTQLVHRFDEAIVKLCDSSQPRHSWSTDSD